MKRIWIAILAVLMVALLCAPALAESGAEAMLKVSMEMSTNEFSGPKDISVTIKLTNTSDQDTPGPVTLYYPDGKIIEEFGAEVLSAGQSKSWSGTWSVTQAQLEKQKITFAYVHPAYDGDGNLFNYQKNFSKAIIYNGAEAQVEINRIISPSMAGKGQEVSVTYEIANSGTVDITDVNIKEANAISKTRGKIESVPAGTKASYTFTVKMGTKDIASQATITYKAGNKTYTEKKDKATIKYGEVNLNASLTADKKGGNPGDTAVLTLKLKNTGKADYEHITVTDPVLGEVFTGQSVAAGKTLELTKEVTITETMGYMFTVTGQDASGNSVETATGRVELVAVSPDQAINLDVALSIDGGAEVRTIPAVVKFRLAVTNNSTVEVKEVKVKSLDVELYEFESILPGQTREFVRDVQVTMQGQYRFDATVRNQLGEAQTFQSNIVRVEKVVPTAEPTKVPLPTPEPPVYEKMPTSDGLPEYVGTVQSALGVVKSVGTVLTLICAALLALGLINRIRTHMRVQDTLERSSTRNYVEEPDPTAKAAPIPMEEQEVSRPIGEDNDRMDLPEIQPGDEDVAQDGALMEETLRQLYPRGDMPAAEENDDSSRRRRSQRYEEQE